MQNDYSAGLANFRRHLAAARLALVSDELYQEAIARIEDIEFENARERQARFTRTAISILNGDT